MQYVAILLFVYVLVNAYLTIRFKKCHPRLEIDKKCTAGIGFLICGVVAGLIIIHILQN